MEDRILITIVIPTFRRIDLLGRLLKDLEGQITESRSVTDGGTGNFGILVIDNCPDASARGVVEGTGAAYVHEPMTGVANARNRGVEMARGTHILFIDDDERPCPGWLNAFLIQAVGGVDACFGPVEPNYAGDVPSELRPMLDRIFSRTIPARTGEDISAWRAYLGTGNSMFSKARCFQDGTRFLADFNGGGEDVCLLRHLVEEKGIRLIWTNEGRVHEVVPASRMTHAFVSQRKFRDGQLRCIVEASAGGSKAVGRVGFWMAVGLVQAVGGSLAALVAYPLDRRRSTGWRMQGVGGMGKLLWWRATPRQT